MEAAVEGSLVAHVTQTDAGMVYAGKVQVAGKVGIGCYSPFVHVGSKPFYVVSTLELVNTVNLLAVIGVDLSALLAVIVSVDEFVLVYDGGTFCIGIQ